MKKLYVFGKSKKALNKRLLNKEEHIIGKEYNIFNPEGYETSHNLKQLKQDTIILYDIEEKILNYNKLGVELGDAIQKINDQNISNELGYEFKRPKF